MKFILCIALVTASLFSVNSLVAQTAAQWANQQKDALATINASSLTDTLKLDTPALEKLLTEIKPDGATDPIVAIRIAALTQFVMQPSGANFRKTYTAALLKAAQQATADDVICFFLNQLRWCGLPQQAVAIQAFEKSAANSVAALATMTVQAVTEDRVPKAVILPDTRYVALNKELATLKREELITRLLQVFDDPDRAYASVALTWARTSGGKPETARWVAKLTSVTDPIRKVMLLDMLAARGDAGATDAITALLADNDEGVAAGAQKALITLDPSIFANQIPVLLKALLPERQLLVRNSIRQLKTSLIRIPLTKSYNDFSNTGKTVALEIIKERRLAEAVPQGLAALDSADQQTVIAGYRLLREIADKNQAQILVTRLLATSGNMTTEVQTTIAAAARRDKSGTYVTALNKAIMTVPDVQKPIVIETAARLGGETLLKSVNAAVASPNAEIATAAVRALAEWPDTTVIPILLRIAVAAPDAKHQTLALRSVTKKLEAGDIDKKANSTVWQSIRKQSINEANKQSIDSLFSK